MALLSKISMAVITHFAVLETVGTILLCYTLAVSLGHVPAWLPMISDCAVQSPERYPFRIGLLVGALTLGFHSVVVYKADRAYSGSIPCLLLGVVGSAALSTVAVVNEVENGHVHYEPTSGLVSRIVKTTCAFVGVACLGLRGAIILQYLPMDIYLAVFEWCDTFTIAIFMWSFLLDDLRKLDIDLVRESTNTPAEKITDEI